MPVAEQPSAASAGSPPAEWVDTHAHLDQDDFAADLPAVLERARAAGVRRIVTIGTTAASSAAAVRLAAEHVGLFAAVGLQPNYTAEAVTGDWDRIADLAAAPRVVALGETGLDRYWDHAPLAVQQDYFDRHLRLAQERDLPVVIHTRESDAEVLEMLREARRRGPLAGVMHSFTGSVETARECCELGLAISFAGMVTFKKSDDFRAVAAATPGDRLLLETDSPYLAPHPRRGSRNEPANLVLTAECMAAIRGWSLAEVAQRTVENACRVFRLPSANPRN